MTLSASQCALVGDPDDLYFQNLDRHMVDLEPLGAFVRTHVQSGVIFDVGANLGAASRVMLEAAPLCRVVAFEPSPVSAAYYRRNIDTRATLIEAGVSDRPGVMPFVMAANRGNCHFTTEAYLYAQAPDFRPAHIPVTTLDAHRPTEGVCLVKIDVEGFEPFVLDGATGLIERDRPWIWMEFNAACLNITHGISPMKFAQWLFEGFEVFDIDLQPWPDPAELTFANMTRLRCIQDVILKPRRTGSDLPTWASWNGR
ncbi:FkbM family methyltransferase [Brevundimonas subvibrioides]|uniref:FkbM family methyltransferase n=1 Tax=Brevundimonas subvibrioides TaxID=74313 RepID=UPI0022B4736E|nr:FkbM family methyltransferase [Brevundimonas subvibrioides]